MAVCTQWCSLIESESFVSAHMSVERPKQRILMANNGQGRRAFFDFVPVEDWLQAPGHALAETLVSDKIICSKPCHGLNLISTSDDDFLCNMSTGAIQCLGRRGKSRFRSHANPSGNAFSVGRSVGLGFDPSTGEHVAVEIGHISGAPACMVKTSSEKQWSCVGRPPRPVTDMPPAHVDGTLYWMSEPAHDRAVVTFDISARVFGILPCEPCSNNDAFLVELNRTLSLVVVDAMAEEMDIWLRHKRGSSSWVGTYKIRLHEQPNYSLKMGQVVMPVDMDGGDGMILLNTGRALGHYDTKTGALETIYSLDQLNLPQSNLAFPVLCQDSLIRIQEDGIPKRVTPSVHQEGCGRCDHPEHAEAIMPGGGRMLNLKCEGGACSKFAFVYRSCCRRLLCEICQGRCLQHSSVDMIRRDPYMLPSYLSNGSISWDAALPFCHPSVPGPEYCYYYSIKNGDVVRHVFVTLDDYMRDRLLCRRAEYGYRMEGHIVKEHWVRRYLKL